jgi:hypothetical protein
MSEMSSILSIALDRDASSPKTRNEEGGLPLGTLLSA